ncbi:hypothetical protein Esti_001203 [Eimeria stiedai]
MKKTRKTHSCMRTKRSNSNSMRLAWGCRLLTACAAAPTRRAASDDCLLSAADSTEDTTVSESEVGAASSLQFFCSSRTQLTSVLFVPLAAAAADGGVAMGTPAEAGSEHNEREPSPEIRFRNYVPKDPKLRQFCLPRPSVDELEKQIAKEAQAAVQAAKEEASAKPNDILSQVAPRRPNWDLKRDVERKITILSRRTDKAIVQLIREKIEQSKTTQELLKDKEVGKKDFETSAENLSREEIEIGHHAQDAGYDRKALQSLTEFRQLHRKTADGRLCAAAFVQDDKTYTDCTTARNPEGVAGRSCCFSVLSYLTAMKNTREVSWGSDLAKRKMTELTQMTAFFHEQNHASQERMQIVEDTLKGSKRAVEELQSNLSKIHALEAVAAHVMEEVERDAEATLENQFNCGADGIRATYYSNPFFRGPPTGYRDEDSIDLKVEGTPAFPGLLVQTFSVRWDGYLVPSVSDRYRLFTYADCGIRVFLDDSPVIVDRMPMPDEGAAFSENVIQPLHPSGMTGVAKMFSGSQDLKAGHRHRLRVEFFHISSHKFKNPDSLAFTDSPWHFLADIPAYYRGLRLLRSQRNPRTTTVHFEVSADCVLFGVATEQHVYALFATRVLPGLVAFEAPPGTSFFAFFEPVRTSEHSCQGAATVVSLTRAATYDSCSQSSAASPQHDCTAGLSGMNLDLPFGTWRTPPGRSVNEYLMVSFKVPVELSEMQFKTLDDSATWPTEIAVEFPGMFGSVRSERTPRPIAAISGTQQVSKFPVRPGDHTYHFHPRVVRGATLRITGKKTLDASAGTGGSVAFIGIPCVQAEREEEVDTDETVSVSFGEMTSGFVPAGFKQDCGSPKAQRGAVVFGWEHSAPLVHPSDCKETSALRSGVSFPEPNCSHADVCSPLVDCDYPNSWSIDMPSLGSYYVTVEVGSPCGDVRLTNLLVNEVPFISNELLHAGQYTKAVGRITLFSSPTIKLTSDTRALDPEGLFGSFVHPGPTPSGGITAAAAAAGLSPATMQLQAGGLTGPFLLPEGWGFTGTLLAPRRTRQEGPVLQQPKQLQQQQHQQLQQQKQLHQQRQLQRHQQIQQYALLAASRLNFPVACSHSQQLLQATAKNQQPMQQQQQQHVLLQHKLRVQQHMQMRQQHQLQQQKMQHQVQEQQLERRQLHQQQVSQQKPQQKQQQQQTSQQQQRNQQQQQILQQQQRLQQRQPACKQRPAQQQPQKQISQLMHQQYPRQRTIDQQQQQQKQKQQQQQQPVDQQQMLLLQGRETGAQRIDLPQGERTCARLSRVPTGHEETLPHQQQQQQLATDADNSGPSAMLRPQQQQQQNEEKQREETQQKQQQQQDSPLQRLQLHLDRHLQELQQQEVSSKASGSEKSSVSCVKEQSILRRRSKCSDSSTAASPRTRSSSSSSSGSTSGRSPPASPESTLIIIDYDDTLLPTNWVAVKHRVGLGDPVPAALQRELQQLTSCIHETISLCLSVGKVVLVTNASLEWVSRSGEKYIPGVWQQLLQQQIEIVSARDRLQHLGIPQRLWKTHVFSEIVGDTLGPLAAAGEPCCLISIGDGEGEREACMQLCRSLPGKGWLFKSLKLLMQPSCSQLTSQHLLLQQAFTDILLVQQSLDMAILDYQLAALDDKTNSLKPLETESGGTTTPSEEQHSVGAPNEGPLGTGPLPVLLAQEQGQRQQLLLLQQQQQQQEALAKQTSFVLKNQRSALGSTSKEKALLRGASCSSRATAAAAEVPCYPLMNAASERELCCSEETVEESLQGQELHQVSPIPPAAAAEAAAANTDAFIDLISAQLASQHLGPPSLPTKGTPVPPTCRRAGRGPQEGAPTTKLLRGPPYIAKGPTSTCRGGPPRIFCFEALVVVLLLGPPSPPLPPLSPQLIRRGAPLTLYVHQRPPFLCVSSSPGALPDDLEAPSGLKGLGNDCPLCKINSPLNRSAFTPRTAAAAAAVAGAFSMSFCQGQRNAMG